MRQLTPNTRKLPNIIWKDEQVRSNVKRQLTPNTRKLPNIIWKDEQVRSNDPYLIVADYTNGLGLVRGQDSKTVPILIKIEDRQASTEQVFGDIEILPAYNPKTDDFFTANPTWAQIEKLLDLVKRGLIRFDLAAPLRTPGAEDVGVPRIDKPIEFKTIDGDVMAIIDYGCPLAHQHFRVKEGSSESRIKFVWHQGAEVTKTERTPWSHIRDDQGHLLFEYGTELGPSSITKLLGWHTADGHVDEDKIYSYPGFEAMQLTRSHGAHVMDVAAGWPDPLDPSNSAPDAAGKANIIFVHLGQVPVADSTGGWMNAHVVDALRYITKRTAKSARVVVNLSYGNYGNPKDGSSLVEQAIDWIIEKNQEERGEDKFDVVIPAGNSFNAACHAELSLDSNDALDGVLNWVVAADDPTSSFMELWYSGDSKLRVSVTEPSGDELEGGGVGKNEVMAWGFDESMEPVCIVVHVGNATKAPGGTEENHCVLVAIAPTAPPTGPRAQASYGVWKVRVQLEDGSGPAKVDAWIQRDDPILEQGSERRQGRFVVSPQDDDQQDYPSRAVKKRGTLNGIATGRNTVVVGGYVLGTDRPSRYTSAGPGRNGVRPHGPDASAPCDESPVLPGRAAAGNRSGAVVRMNGTSVAAPQVSRALLNNEWRRPDTPRGPLEEGNLDWLRGADQERRLPTNRKENGPSAHEEMGH